MGRNQRAEQRAPLVVIEHLADCMEDLVDAIERGEVEEVSILTMRNRDLRRELSNAGTVSATDLSREQLDGMLQARERLRVLAARLSKLPPAEEARRRAPAHAKRATTDEEAAFLKIISDIGARDFSDFVPEPDLYTTGSGTPLFGYDSQNLVRALFHWMSHGIRGRFPEALQVGEELERAFHVERMRLEFLSLVFPPALWKRFHKPIEDGQHREPVEELVLRLYEAKTGRPLEEITRLLEHSVARGQALWDRVVTDEENPTHEQLSAFYNGQEFPEGDCFPVVLASGLGCALRMLPCWIATEHKLRSVFDYGGGSGVTISALMAQGMERAVLIEENQAAIDFARWRDRAAGINGVEYLRESGLIDRLDVYQGQFDFGVCTEVLEHVIDVEATVERMAKLIRPGGFLFQSTSFGLYPFLSHLSPNRRYYNREDELMARFGFERVPVGAPIPTLANQRLYQRKAN